ncbi:MAG: acyl-ACP--UDP-N-acetylglucosamine O-acyltransferase [Bacteroidales bacterium]|nr:acyl-ACP--UDP-N-acetylglucosamine O-acyltransferase [Bacteroidales bacterium]
MIHQLAYVHPDAKIGNNVVIEPFSTIAADVVIGDDTWIGPNATVMDGARIGKKCRIFPGAVVSAIPQDLKFAGEITTAEIGDNTTIREAVTVNRGTKSRGKTVVGNNCLLMAYVHIAHDCVVGNNTIIANSVQIAGEVEIGDFVIFGGTSAVHQFVKIGDHSMISGGSLVGKDIPPYVTVAHTPLAYVGLNSIGLRRRNFSNDEINLIQDIYRIIFQSGLNTSNAVNKIKTDIENCEAKENILNFIENSNRGLIKGFLPNKE